MKFVIASLVFLFKLFCFVGGPPQAYHGAHRIKGVSRDVPRSNLKLFDSGCATITFTATRIAESVAVSLAMVIVGASIDVLCAAVEFLRDLFWKAIIEPSKVALRVFFLWLIGGLKHARPRSPKWAMVGPIRPDAIVLHRRMECYSSMVLAGVLFHIACHSVTTMMILTQHRVVSTFHCGRVFVKNYFWSFVRPFQYERQVLSEGFYKIGLAIWNTTVLAALVFVQAAMDSARQKWKKFQDTRESFSNGFGVVFHNFFVRPTKFVWGAFHNVRPASDSDDSIHATIAATFAETGDVSVLAGHHDGLRNYARKQRFEIIRQFLKTRDPSLAAKKFQEAVKLHDAVTGRV